MKKKQEIINPLITIALVRYKELGTMKTTGREIKNPVVKRKKRK